MLGMKPTRIILIVLQAVGLALSVQAAPKPQEANVWFITLDGVRWQDVFKDKTVFPNLHRLAQSAFLVGDVDRREQVVVSNDQFVSLPAYHSLMTGEAQLDEKKSCKSNECGRVKSETFFERLMREKQWRRNQIAAFATWEKIPFSLEQNAGTIVSNAGQTEFKENPDDQEVARINRLQLKGPSLLWNEIRWDHITHAFALNHINSHRPRLLYVSYGEADLWGHADDRANYLATLKTYDRWIGELHALKKSLGAYGKNLYIIVTTDHGRGNGTMWKDHGPTLPEAKHVWIFASGPTVASPKRGKGVQYAHVDIRPTIEKIFGLKPYACSSCGKPIRDIIR